MNIWRGIIGKFVANYIYICDTLITFLIEVMMLIKMGNRIGFISYPIFFCLALPFGYGA